MLNGLTTMSMSPSPSMSASLLSWLSTPSANTFSVNVPAPSLIINRKTASSPALSRISAVKMSMSPSPSASARSSEWPFTVRSMRVIVIHAVPSHDVNARRPTESPLSNTISGRPPGTTSAIIARPWAQLPAELVELEGEVSLIEHEGATGYQVNVAVEVKIARVETFKGRTCDHQPSHTPRLIEQWIGGYLG